MKARIEEKVPDFAVRLDRPADAFAVRRAVFMEEQGYADEFDARDDDPACAHLALYADGRLVGCARITSLALEQRAPSSDPAMPASPLDGDASPAEIFRFGRIAVLPEFRGRGFAHDIVRACEAVARSRGTRVIKLHAQEYIQGLYAAHGYAAFGDVDYEDEGQPHVWMVKRL